MFCLLAECGAVVGARLLSGGNVLVFIGIGGTLVLGLLLKVVLDNSGLLPRFGSCVMPVTTDSSKLGLRASCGCGYLVEVRRLKRSAFSISSLRCRSMRWFSRRSFRLLFHSLNPPMAPKTAMLSLRVWGYYGYAKARRRSCPDYHMSTCPYFAQRRAAVW